MLLQTKTEMLPFIKNEKIDMISKPRKRVGKYVLSKTLGRGSMGKVKLALNTETNKDVNII